MQYLVWLGTDKGVLRFTGGVGMQLHMQIGHFPSPARVTI